LPLFFANSGFFSLHIRLTTYVRHVKVIKVHLGEWEEDLMDDRLIQRINELARKAKRTSLTADEMVERDELRKRYLEQFRGNFKQQLDSIKLVDQDEIQESDGE
jgi:uncharacterized protein YnzC (UPF0291/DUF896 family)